MPTFQAPSVRPSSSPAPGGAPVSQAVAALIAGGAAGAAQAQSRAFSPGWFADKGAAQSAVQRSGRLPDGSLAGVGNASQQQAQSRQQLQRSLDNLNRTAAAVAAQQRRSRRARGGGQWRRRAGRTDAGRPVGGRGRAGQMGAKAPQKSTADGRQVVTIEQTQSRAILNWDSFNVGRNTTLQFKQNASDAALNRVVGASAKPSEIHGAIKADGTVLVVNQNGVIFTGTSQVNARNLVAAAAAITDQQFRDKGIYTDANGTQPTFKDALGQIQVQAGARIDTAASTTATKGGGYVLLLGREVHNAGVIATPGGQTALAAGDDFYIRKGYGTDGNLKSTTAGNEVSATLKPASTAGLVRNSGLISATTGDITLTGHQIRQDGVLVASTDIGARGAIPPAEPRQRRQRQRDAGRGQRHRRAAGAIRRDRPGDQRTAALKTLDGLASNNTAGVFDNLSTVADRPDLPRIEVVSGNLASFLDGSTTLATGGQIAVSARRQTLLDAGARLVAGAIGVRLAMESNNLKIDVQGNEQRDAPVSQDSKLLNNNARSGSTGARWSRCRAAPTAMPASAGTPAAACWKWAATWPPAGARQANGWPRAAPPPSPAARWSPTPARTSTCPAARWTCRTGTSARAGCAVPTAASTTCRARPATCSTPACTRASSRCTSAGATRPRGSSTTP